MTVPRKLPRTQDQRVQNVARTHAAQSLGGSTAAARPVAKVTPDVKVYQAPAGAVVLGLVGSGDATSITSTGGGPGSSNASGAASVSIGSDSGPTGVASVNVGNISYAPGDAGVAVGYNAKALAANSTGVGPLTTANQPGASAFGYGAQATEENDIVLGTAVNHVKIPGALILTDGSGGLWRVVVDTSGALSTVAYP